MSASGSDVIKLLSQQALKQQKRQLAHLKQIADEDLFKYGGLLIGNDPLVRLADFGACQIEGEFAFVGTSLFGAVRRACNLAKTPSHGSKFVPTVIIVDNSYEVTMCWQEVKKFFQTSELDNSSKLGAIESEFINSFVMDVAFDYIRDGDLNAIRSFFRELFTDHQFEYIKAVVQKMVVIKQSWSDTTTFAAIKDAYEDMPIVAYPSNIISFVDDPRVKLGVLQCIEILNPRLCIYSNLVGIAPHRRPSSTIMVASGAFTIKDIAESLGLEQTIITSCTKKVTPTLTITAEEDVPIATTPAVDKPVDEEAEKVTDDKPKDATTTVTLTS